jgi:hypothetical protein
MRQEAQATPRRRFGTDLGEADATCESGSRDPLEDLTVLLEEKNAMTANTSIDPAESWRSSWRPRRWIHAPDGETGRDPRHPALDTSTAGNHDS